MGEWWYKHTHFCRWCGKVYESKKPRTQPGFCCPKHKQAHWRAYKKYVTVISSKNRLVAGRKVTHKKKKKQ